MAIVRLRQDSVRVLPFVGKDEKAQCIYWDEETEGFGVRVYSSGHRSYVVTYHLLGQKRTPTLGRVDVMTLQVARALAKSYIGAAAVGKDPEAERKAAEAAQKSFRLGKLCDLYVEGHAKPHKKTWKNDQSLLKRFIKPRLENRLPASIHAGDLSPIHKAYGAKHPYAANTLLRVYRRMVNWAKDEKLLPKDYENPTKGIVRFPERRRKVYVKQDEMPLVLASIDQEPNDYQRVAMWLLLLLGMRVIELLRAKRSDIDWQGRTLFIGYTKNGEPILVPLSDVALALFASLPAVDGNPYFFVGRKTGHHLTDLGAALKRALTRVGLKEIRIHDLRRTVGSWLAQSGVSLHLIGDILNHLDQETTAGYAFFQTEQRREALGGHAEKILRFAAPEARLPRLPAGLRTETLLPVAAGPVVLPKPAGFRNRHYFKREALYELVWTAPVSEVAERLGVSDVALAKLCRGAAIPIPYRGYWAKMNAGYLMARTPLPPSPPGLPELLRILGGREATTALIHSGDAAVSVAA